MRTRAQYTSAQNNLTTTKEKITNFYLVLFLFQPIVVGGRLRIDDSNHPPSPISSLHPVCPSLSFPCYKYERKIFPLPTPQSAFSYSIGSAQRNISSLRKGIKLLAQSLYLLAASIQIQKDFFSISRKDSMIALWSCMQSFTKL